MQGRLHTAGEIVDIDCGIDWVWSLLVESAGGGLSSVAKGPAATVQLVVESSRQPFDDAGSVRLTRGASIGSAGLILADACASGFSLRIKASADQLLVTARYRPDTKTRAASMLLRSRFHLIARAVLVQYPAMWWAGTRGRAPMHVSALTSDAGVVLLAGPGGVGKSTLVARHISAGSLAVCDNLAVSDGVDVFGVAEPLRIAGRSHGTGRRVPHGRREAPWPGERPVSLRPERIAVVQLRDAPEPSCVPIPDDVASRSLITGTFMAGELRRYWAFGATLSAATGLGPAQPPIEAVARRMAASLPCYLLTLARTPALTAGPGVESSVPRLGQLFASELEGRGI